MPAWQITNHRPRLAKIRDPDVVIEGETIKGRMHIVMDKVEKAIKECGNAIDTYYKQKFIGEELIVYWTALLISLPSQVLQVP